jgi:hypothetical protein
MIEVKGNTLIIKLDKKEDTAIFGEIIDFVNAKVNKSGLEKLFKLADEYRIASPDFKFNREEIYNEDSRFCR